MCGYLSAPSTRKMENDDPISLVLAKKHPCSSFFPFQAEPLSKSAKNVLSGVCPKREEYMFVRAIPISLPLLLKWYICLYLNIKSFEPEIWALAKFLEKKIPKKEKREKRAVKGRLANMIV